MAALYYSSLLLFLQKPILTDGWSMTSVYLSMLELPCHLVLYICADCLISWTHGTRCEVLLNFFLYIYFNLTNTSLPPLLYLIRLVNFYSFMKLHASTFFNPPSSVGVAMILWTWTERLSYLSKCPICHFVFDNNQIFQASIPLRYHCKAFYKHLVWGVH